MREPEYTTDKERREKGVNNSDPLENEPPTEKQVRYLRYLGYYRKIVSKKHATDLIDEILGKK